MVLLAVVLLVNYIDRGALGTAGPLIQRDLHLTNGQYGLLFSAFFWVYAIIQIPVGALAERFGAHRVLTAAAGMAGQTDVATAALQELRLAQPNISVAWIAVQMPIKQEAERQHYLEAFRRAGLH